MSERITWKSCPVCHRAAAVGWLEQCVVEFDCPRGCRISRAQLEELQERGGEVVTDGPSP